jgi:hypothetical protein
MFPATCLLKRVSFNMFLATCFLEYVSCNLFPLTRFLQHISCNMFPGICFLQHDFFVPFAHHQVHKASTFGSISFNGDPPSQTHTYDFTCNICCSCSAFHRTQTSYFLDNSEVFVCATNEKLAQCLCGQNCHPRPYLNPSFFSLSWLMSLLKISAIRRFTAIM